MGEITDGNRLCVNLQRLRWHAVVHFSTTPGATKLGSGVDQPWDRNACVYP